MSAPRITPKSWYGSKAGFILEEIKTAEGGALFTPKELGELTARRSPTAVRG